MGCTSRKSNKEKPQIDLRNKKAFRMLHITALGIMVLNMLIQDVAETFIHHSLKGCHVY